MVQPILHYSATSHRGQRDNNEDTYLSLPEHGLWLVADGMGGHQAGEVASAIVAQTLRTQTQKPLKEALEHSHQAVLEAANRGIGAPGMGSTAVVLCSHNNDYEVAWVGDSRAYLWTPSPEGGLLERLTRDHSYVQMLLASGAIGPDEVENHPDKNIITQCLGSQQLEALQVDSVQGSWQPEQCILLCSDGLTDELSDRGIADILSQAPDPRAGVRRLLRAALKEGGHDNITLLLVCAPSPRRLRGWRHKLQKAQHKVATLPWLGRSLYIVLLVTLILLLLLVLR